mgnify:CR=1 FL=1
MTDPAELFAILTAQIEDLHGLAFEGQAADQPHELLCALSRSLCCGLQRANGTLTQIDNAIIQSE